MKVYLTSIKKLQEILLGVSIGALLVVPMFYAFVPEVFSQRLITVFFTVSLAAVFFVMSIRPLADIFINERWLRSLVILRKGFGVLSASIIVSLFIGKCIAGGASFLASIGTSAYWSLDRFALLAHLGDLTAIILLVTSNSFSKRVLGPWWKRIQKLAYVYFYAGALYELLMFQSWFALGALIVVTVLVSIAFIFNTIRRHTAPGTQTVPQSI